MNCANVLITIIILFGFQNALANEQPKAFFDTYIQLGNNFDSSITDLYLDTAKIHTYRKYPHSLERAMVLNGEQWKKLAVKIMPLAKAQDDKSIFSDVTISNYNNGYKIKANRYSSRKCYMDFGYYMIVKPDETGKLKINEEYSETQPESNCKE